MIPEYAHDLDYQIAIEASRADHCTRTICWQGKVETIIVPDHLYAWDGEIPCTGNYRCVHCGYIDPDA